jgi:hypothetical protein
VLNSVNGNQYYMELFQVLMTLNMISAIWYDHVTCIIVTIFVYDIDGMSKYNLTLLMITS